MPNINDRHFSELRTRELLEILRLRIDVFVVEQACAYPEIDGRDQEPHTRHLWIAHGEELHAYLRLLLEPEGGWRIGRVATAKTARGQGLASQLLQRALDTTEGPWTLDAQRYLQPWYEGFGFTATGPVFLDFGIEHVPMRRDV